MYIHDLGMTFEMCCKVTEEKGKVSGQCSEQLSDLNSLRKELLQAEQARLELESEKMGLGEKIKFLEIEKEKVEFELGQAARERVDLGNQLSVLARKKETLSEDSIRLRQRLEQSNEMNARLNRNLEDLVKDNEEKQVLHLLGEAGSRVLRHLHFFQILLETGEKEFQRLQEQLASLRSEKESLEGVLFDTQTNLEAIHVGKSQLEKEQRELLIKQEGLRQRVSSLSQELDKSERRQQETRQSLVQQSEHREAEYEQVILSLKKQSEDVSKKLLDEKVP